MAKSAAEKMKDYRKRLKQDPEKYQEYLNKAKKRKRQNYTPVSQLSRKEKQRMRDKTRDYVRQHRLKKKLESAANQHEESMISETSGYETNHQEPSPRQLVVNFPFPNRRHGPKKRNSRALARKSREVKSIKMKYDELEKKYKRTLRSLQRFRKNKPNKITSREAVADNQAGCSYAFSSENISPESESEQAPLMSTPNKRTQDTPLEPQTPRSKTKLILKRARLNKKQCAILQKDVLFSNIVQEQVTKNRNEMKRKEIGALRGLIGGKILSKYRLAKVVNRSTGLGRNRVANIKSGVGNKNYRRAREIVRYKDLVLNFLARDDNSRCNPGKQDKLKVNGESRQTRVLTDYLKNLYLKFMGEHPGIKLSLSSFCRIRPANFKLTKFISRSCCLCTRHQNFALCTQALRKLGLAVPLNPEKFIEDNTNIETMKENLTEEITFGQWKRVPIEDKGRKKMIMKVVTCTMTKPEFLQHMELKIKEFSEHVYRVRRQYEESQKIKKNLAQDEVVVNMDFAENYACKSVEEIQSAYWNQSAVTLHPVVLYFKDKFNNLKHQSVVIVSDEMGHNSSSVLTFLDHIVPEIKKYVTNVKKIHYFTDSPSSQYRNKAIFRVVANHESIYNCKAVWNFFEAGHGKGPCDGLGGTTKRMADDAVKTGKVTIQDGEEFFRWTQSDHCTMKSVKFIYVPSSACQQKLNDLNIFDIKPVKGTMKLHAVVGKGDNIILTSTVSCYCEDCIHSRECKINTWTSETLSISLRNNTNDSEGQSTTGATSVKPPENEITLDFSVGQFVAARYEQKLYIGQIVECDNVDGEVEINFMQNVRRLLQWPKFKDKIWVDRKSILCNVSEPIPTGKSKRMFKLNDYDLQKIESDNMSYLIRTCFDVSAVVDT